MTSFFVVKKGAAGTGGSGTSGAFGPTEEYGILEDESGDDNAGIDPQERNSGTRYDGHYYALGGSSSGSDYRYNPFDDTWHSITQVTGGTGVDKTFGRSAGLSTSFWGAFVTFMGGGEYDSGSSSQANLKYIPYTDSVYTSLSLPYSQSSGIGTGADYFSGTMIYGGQASSVVTNLSYFYDANSDTFTSKTNMPIAKSHFSTFYSKYGDEYAVGGKIVGGTITNNNRYIPSIDSWQTLDPIPYNTSSTPGSGAIWLIGEATGGQVCGGFDFLFASSLNKAYRYNSDSWIDKTAMPAAKYHMGGFGSPDASCYLIGGRNAVGSDTDTVLKYDGVDDSFTNKNAFAGSNTSGVAGSPGRGK